MSLKTADDVYVKDEPCSDLPNEYEPASALAANIWQDVKVEVEKNSEMCSDSDIAPTPPLYKECDKDERTQSLVDLVKAEEQSESARLSEQGQYIKEEVKAELELGPTVFLRPRVTLVCQEVEIEYDGKKPVSIKEEPSCEVSSKHAIAVPAEKIRITSAIYDSKPVIVKQEPLESESITSPDPPTCSTDQSQATTLKANGDRQTNQTGTYICDTCGNTYHQMHYLIQHIQRKFCSNSAEKSYSCDTCNNKFATRSSLNQHKHTHASTKPYSCKICSQQFTVLSYLKAHERRHAGERPFNCNICQKAFAKLSDVEKHKRIHTGDKPYFCEECDKKFAHLSDLNKHKRTHTGERPYSCDICNKKFKISTHLNTHKRIHSGKKPYSCDICNKQFYDEASLTMHKRVHTGEKPYACDICEKVFSRNSSLIIHRRIHTHVFLCEICKKNFKQLANLKKHSKRHTRENTTRKKKNLLVIEIL